MKHFGGLQGVLNAGEDEIKKIPGINKTLAEAIYFRFHESWFMNYAIIITYLRIALIPIMVLLFFLSSDDPRYSLTFIFFLAAITDYLDGFIARKMNLMSEHGKFLDPVADKLLVASSLLIILADNNELIIFIPTCIIILREIMVSAIREWAAREDIKDLVEVNYLGKLKTFVQMISIGFLLFNGTIFTIDIYLLGLYGINIAAFLSLLSMLIYLKNVIKP